MGFVWKVRLIGLTAITNMHNTIALISILDGNFGFITQLDPFVVNFHFHEQFRFWYDMYAKLEYCPTF